MCVAAAHRPNTRGMSAASSPGAADGGAAGAGAAEGARRDRHAASFKLRFAAQREPGRSYVSAVKPLGLPATVTGKFYARGEADAAGERERREAALARIRAMFERGPRERLAAPLTSAHEVGWWWREGAARRAEERADRRRSHHLRDSPWLKGRLLVLAAGAR